MTITKNGRTIDTLEDWGKLAAPKSAAQWKDGASAKEAARYWLAFRTPALPPELEALLAGNPGFGKVDQWHAEPEVRLAFDAFAGEPRDTDLLVTARDPHGAFLIAVDATVNETFGLRLSKTITVAKGRTTRDPRSNPVARAERLVKGLLGPRKLGEPAIGELRYQLLTAAAGVLAAGRERGMNRVVLVVQEFETPASDAKSRSGNARDLEHFVEALSGGSVSRVDAGTLYGPFSVPGTMLFEGAVPGLWVGRVVARMA
jgi:hypothetical protein